MTNQTNKLSRINIRQTLKYASLFLLGLMWTLGLLMIATRPIVRVVTSQQPINNFTELFTQYNTYNPREDKQLATKFQQATQQINGNQLIIWIQSNVDSNRQRQLHLYAQIWAYPKVIQNNPVLYDTQHDKLPEDLDGCQMITKAIVLCPYSE